jgi:hypothetical protein
MPVIHLLLTVYFAVERRWTELYLWICGTLCGIGTTWTALYWFGNLMF